MAAVSPDFLVIGLDNGSIAGWTLSSNNLAYIPAHTQGAIITMKKHNDFLISGDRTGHIQIRSISGGYELFVPEIAISNPAMITSLHVLEVQSKNENFILAADTNGYLNVIKIDPSLGTTVSQLGAFLDDKNKRHRALTIFATDDTGSSFFVVGENGLVRKWVVS